MSTSRRAITFGTRLLYGVAIVLAIMAVRDRLLGRSVSTLLLPTPALQQSIGAESFSTLAVAGQRLGPSDAAVTVVVFSNYLCGHCAEFESTLARLRERYPDHVAVVMKHFVPSRDRNQVAIQAAAECAADQGRFAQYNHAFFRLGQQIVAREPWRQIGDSIDIPDRGRFAACVRSHKYDLRVARDTRQGTDLGIDGTPTSFINGQRAIGTLSFDALDHFVATELGRVTHAP